MTKTDQMNLFGTIKVCPACGAKETWGDNYALGINVYPVREFEREYIFDHGYEPENRAYIISTCWRCGCAWREAALFCVEEDDED